MANQFWAGALVNVSQIRPSKARPEFRPIESVVNPITKCNMIGWSYFAATH
jgi:hypothetical protein